MKKINLLLAILFLSVPLTNCKKSSGPSFSYIVNGLSDVTVRQYGDTTLYLPVSVEYESGAQEPVTISAVNLPSGITLTPATISGTPTFSTPLTFGINLTSSGTFPVTITSTSASTSKKTFSFNVIVTPSSDCTSEVAGSFSSMVTTCTSYSGYGTGNFAGGTIAKTDSANQVTLPTGFGYLQVDLNCSSSSFTLNPASIDGIYFSQGSGSYSGNTITITYTMTGSVNSTCTSVFTK